MGGAGEAVKAVMDRSGFTRARVASVMGVSPQVVNGFINRSASMKVDNAARMLDAMGYDVVFVPRGTKLPSGSVVVKADHDG